MDVHTQIIIFLLTFTIVFGTIGVIAIYKQKKDKKNKENNPF